ncbi:unnamed protein product [Schistosoma turkestanicum]|nr:unnamed protein product [Schistosoma turkestanicum]
MADNVKKEQYYDKIFSFGSVSSRCNVKCMISEKVCKIAFRMITQCKQNSLKTYLYGRYSFVGVSSLNVIVNRIELNKQCYQSCAPDEFLIPFELAKYDIFSGAKNQYLDCAVRTIWNNYTLKPISLDITNCIQFWAYACVTKNGDSTNSRIKKLRNSTSEMYFSKFKVECLVLDYLVSLTPVEKPSLVPSLLVKSLETPDFHLSAFTESLNNDDSESDVRFGFLKMTNTGQISLHLETDPAILTSSPIGIWISGVKEVCDFRVWKTCLHFILINDTQISRSVRNDHLGFINSTNNSPMLLAVYGCDSNLPQFYETSIVFSPDTDAFDSSVNVKLYRNFKDPVQLKFTVLSSLEDWISLPKFSSRNSEYFTWNLVNNTLDKEHLTTLKNSVKQFCDSVRGLEYFEENFVHLTTSVFSEVSQISIHSVSENQSNVKDDVNSHPSSREFKSLNLSESHVLEASLLSEEGVSNLYQNFEGSHSCRITSEQLDEESLPREPPRKSNDFIRSSESSENNITQEDANHYDPNRYRNFSTPISSNASNLQVDITSTQYPPHTGSVDNKLSFSQVHSRFDSTDITLHFRSILSNLPLNQLERLERIINNMLGKKKIVCLAPDTSKDGCEHKNNQDYPNKHDLKRGISIGVNTTFVSTGVNLNDKEQLSDTQSCDILNNRDVQYSVFRKKLSFKTKRLCMLHHSSNINYSRPETVTNSNPISQIKSSSSVHSKTIKGEELQMDSQCQNDTADKYSSLLANIKQLLNNRTRYDSAASAPCPNNNNNTKEFVDQEMRTSNSIPTIFLQKDLMCLVNSNKNPENVNRRVSNWLQCDQTNGNNNSSSSASKVNDIALCKSNFKRAEIHTYVDLNCSTSQLNMNKKSTDPESIQDMHQVNVKLQNENLSNSVCVGDTDESTYLSSLVNKYLSHKDVGSETMDTDSSIAVNYSLATLDYMKRNGLIECYEDKCKRNTSPVVSSILIANHQKALHNFTGFNDQKDDSVNIRPNRPSSAPFLSVDSKSPDVHRSLTIGESIPNIMNELHLDTSHMKQSTGICNPSFKYFCTSFDCSSEKDTSVRPTSEYSHTFDNGLGVTNSPILDLERLRSLPKLL